VNDELPRLTIPAGSIHPSGLWVPIQMEARQPIPQIPEGSLYVAAGPPSDADGVYVAPDSEALGFAPTDLDSVRSLLDQLPFEPAMFALSMMNASAWFIGHDQAKHLELAQNIFGDGWFLEKLKAFVAESPHHIIFNEQHVTVLQRLLITSAASDGQGLRDLFESEIEALLRALIAIADPIASSGHRATAEGDPTTWVPFVVRSGLYFDKSNLGSDQGRAYALFVDIFSEADRDQHNWCDLGCWMSEDLASFLSQLGFGYAMGAWSKALEEETNATERRVAIVTDGLLSNQLPPETVSRLVDAIGASRGQLAESFSTAGESLDHIIWDRAPFEQRPFLRLEDGRLILMSPRFLHSWMGEGFYYRLLDSASRRPLPGHTGRTQSRRFTEFHGDLFEEFVLRLTTESHRVQISVGIAEVCGEQTYLDNDESESLSSDVTVALGPDLVFIEAAGGRVARRARILSEPSEMLEVVDRIVGKMHEVSGVIDDYLDGLIEIGSVESQDVARIWPIVVIASPVLQSEFLWGYIADRISEAFVDARVQPPTLLSLDEFEQLMALVEEGRGIPDLLANRLGSAHANLPPARYFAMQSSNLARPQYVERKMREAGGLAIRELFPRPPE